MLNRKAYADPNDPLNPFYKDGTVDYDRVQGGNPLAGGQYPRMMFRPGGTELHHGVMVDTTTVYDEVEQEQHEADGWRTTPKKAEALAQRLIADAPVVDVVKRGPGRPPSKPLAGGNEPG